MKKISITAILIVFIITYSVGLTGCTSIKDKSDISTNNPTTISRTNGTSISNSTSNSTSTMPTQSSSSLSTSTKAIDYNEFVKKVWVVKSWTINEAYDNYYSFCIYEIANGKFKGKFSISAIAEPDDEFYSPDYLGNLTGTINNDTAKCQFSDPDGNNGNITIVLRKSDEIEATIEYASISKYNKDNSLDGTFLFRPYNLKDIDGFNPFEDQSLTVDLNSWGTVKFVSGKILGGNHIPTVAYLTNKDGDIFYSFNSYLPNNVDFNAVSFQDVNKDGLKDIIIIYSVENDSSTLTARIFAQKPDGLFSVDGDLDQEINDSGNNKDIKTITDYLSKKF